MAAVVTGAILPGAVAELVEEVCRWCFPWPNQLDSGSGRRADLEGG